MNECPLCGGPISPPAGIAVAAGYVYYNGVRLRFHHGNAPSHRVLARLIRAHPNTVSHLDLYETLFGVNHDLRPGRDEVSLRVRLTRLRTDLRRQSVPLEIKNEFSVGYRLIRKD